MLNYNRDDMREYISRIGGSLTGLQIGAGTTTTAVQETSAPEEARDNQPRLPIGLS